MKTILLDGESKAGKTSVTNAIAEGIAPDLSIRTADAGAFFRRITAAVIDIVGLSDIPDIDQSALSEAVDKVIAAGIPFDDGYPWGDLERPAVGGLVSTLGQLPSTQAAAEQWFGLTVGHTQNAGTDVLLMNARNPRDRLRGHNIGLVMELLIKCDPEVAGRRMLKDTDEPTPEALQAATAEVLGRRAKDRNREVHPFLDTPYTVPFTLGESDPQAVVREAWAAAPEDPPLPIDFDTTHMPFKEMRKGAQALARCALNLVE